MDMRTYKKVSVPDLVPYARNSRTHTDNQIQQICDSISQFGFTNPLLIDGKNQIIAGHGRLEAAKRLGIKELPCIVVDGLTEEQQCALVIADNKIAANAGWDYDLLQKEINFLIDADFDFTITGFSEEELSALRVPDFEEKTNTEIKQKSVKYLTCPHCHQEFESNS